MANCDIDRIPSAKPSLSFFNGGVRMYTPPRCLASTSKADNKWDEASLGKKLKR